MRGWLLWLSVTATLVACPQQQPRAPERQPAAGALAVPLETSLVFTFTEPMDEESLEAAIQVDPPVLCDWRWSAEATVAACAPRFELIAAQTYTISFRGAPRARTGQTVPLPASSFTTTDPRAPLAFDTDPRVLRGTWTGTVSDYPSQGQQGNLHLELTATYLDERRYEINGRLTLGTLTIDALGGYALGLNSDRYVGALERKAYAVLQGTSSTREGTWFLKCQRPVTLARYACTFEVSGGASFPVELRRAE